MAAETFVARLDRVPLNRFHWRLLILSGLGWMFDAMDVLMLSFLLTPIRAEFKLDATGACWWDRGRECEQRSPTRALDAPDDGVGFGSASALREVAR